MTYITQVIIKEIWTNRVVVKTEIPKTKKDYDRPTKKIHNPYKQLQLDLLFS